MEHVPAEDRKQALALVRAALEAVPGEPFETACRAAFDFLRVSPHKRLVALAHLVRPGTDPRAVQAALVPLERAERRLRVTDVEMGIRTTDDATAPRDVAPVIAVADNIRSAFNAGGLFRTAEFFGLEKLVLCGFTPTPESEAVRKTALGSDEAVPWEHAEDIRQAMDRLRAEGVAIYALETADGACDLTDPTFSVRFPCALLLGNERFGLDPDVVAAADAVLQIPSYGRKNSLNVVSAFAVAAAFVRARLRGA